MDEKGRIFVPAVYRKILAEAESKRIVMRRDKKTTSHFVGPFFLYDAGVVELADTQDLGSCAIRCAGSSPVARTKR